MRILQVTLGAAATRVTTAQIYSPFIIIQNNAAANCRVGDNTVSASKGIQLNTAAGGGGSLTVHRSDNRVLLSQYYIFGTAGNVIDVLYE